MFTFCVDCGMKSMGLSSLLFHFTCDVRNMNPPPVTYLSLCVCECECMSLHLIVSLRNLKMLNYWRRSWAFFSRILPLLLLLYILFCCSCAVAFAHFILSFISFDFLSYLLFGACDRAMLNQSQCLLKYDHLALLSCTQHTMFYSISSFSFWSSSSALLLLLLLMLQL